MFSAIVLRLWLILCDLSLAQDNARSDWKGMLLAPFNGDLGRRVARKLSSRLMAAAPSCRHEMFDTALDWSSGVDKRTTPAQTNEQRPAGEGRRPQGHGNRRQRGAGALREAQVCLLRAGDMACA